MQNIVGIVKSLATIEKAKPFFVLCFVLIMAAQTLGEFQGIVFGNVSIAKIIVPLLSIILVTVCFPKLPKVPLFFIPLILAILWTTFSLKSGTADYVTQFVHLTGYVILMVCMFNTLKSVKDMNTILTAYCLALGLVSVLILLAFFAVIPPDFLGHDLLDASEERAIRMLGTELNPNAFALLFTIGIPCLVHFLHQN